MLKEYKINMDPEKGWLCGPRLPPLYVFFLSLFLFFFFWRFMFPDSFDWDVQIL